MSNFPPEFIKRIESDAFYPSGLLKNLDTPAPTSVRLHPRRNFTFAESSAVAWNPDGVYLQQRPSFTYDPCFHAGCYYPQEAGSMYLLQVLKRLALPENPVVLDLSAAPGGKSTLIAGFLNQKGLLLANEINRSRAYILAENLTKWGYSNTFVCNHSPQELASIGPLFDVIVVDAPCSGEGMFRKDPAARDEWTPAAANHCVSRQAEILEAAWPLLKVNGYLIYSTCTFNPEENETLLQQSLIEEFEANPVELPHFEGLQADRKELGYYFFPGQTQSEGFYIAAFQKNTHTGKSAKKQKNKEKGKGKAASIQVYNEGELLKEIPLQSTIAHAYWSENEQLKASTHFAFELFKNLPKLNWLKTGVQVGQFFKKSWAPAYDMVYSLDLQWPLKTMDMELEQALQVLHGESQACDLEPGHYFATYNGQKFALLKQLGQRFNNLHPTEWRIRHLPKK
jgi:16S rRNA C967 or C1407 C5-methylase (RsmB/RsmF family)